jgi:predicted nicotinamide N-methyase
VSRTTLLRNLRLTVSTGDISVTRLPLCPAIRLYLLSDDYPRGPLPSDEMLAIMDSPAYWSFCWASGQALARYILDHPSFFAGKQIVDFGTGSGVVAIAAAKVGAKEVYACDIDPHALDAACANAELNKVDVKPTQSLDDIPGRLDMIIAADVLYDRDNHHYLEEFRQLAADVVVADSRMKDGFLEGYRLVRQISASTLPDINEFEEFNRVRIYHDLAPEHPTVQE